MPLQEYFILLCIAVVAFMYASVGHGGASGYLALMAIFGMAPDVMKPSALVLNIIVSAISFIMYYRKGHFKFANLLPFIILSIPLAYFGAKILIDPRTYKIILGICLLIATLRLAGIFGKTDFKDLKPIKFLPALLIGGVLGFVSGMIGIGGGILLSPVLLFLKWADMKQTAAVSAAFIFLNSVSGIIGSMSSHQAFSSGIFAWVVAAVIGGSLGAFYGSGRFNNTVLRYILSLVLVFASYKLFIG